MTDAKARPDDGRRLVVMSHFDPDGQVAPHVRFCIESLRPVADKFIVVTTSDLERPAREWLESRVILFSRPNRGFDFCSHKLGLEAGDPSAFSEVVLLNDGFVFPLAPINDVFDAMTHSPASFWGLTQSQQYGHRHIQSFFMVFRSDVIQSAQFRHFWQQVDEINDKWLVSMKYEVGLSQALLEHGFNMDSYFHEDWLDLLAVLVRGSRSELRRNGRRAALRFAFGSLRGDAIGWNPYFTLADRVLDHGRLPFVKLNLLREDPDRLDAGYLLAACEERFPEAFRGVRAYLLRTGAGQGNRWARTWEAASPLSPHFGPPGFRKTLRRLTAPRFTHAGRTSRPSGTS